MGKEPSSSGVKKKRKAANNESDNEVDIYKVHDS